MAKTTKVEDAAERWLTAQHVAKEIGGRAANEELRDARDALKQAAGLRPRPKSE